MGKIIGIDLGTTNSCVALMEGITRYVPGVRRENESEQEHRELTRRSSGWGVLAAELADDPKTFTQGACSGWSCPNRGNRKPDASKSGLNYPGRTY